MVLTDAFQYPITIDGCRVFNFCANEDPLDDIALKLKKGPVDLAQIEIYFLFIGHFDMFRPEDMFADRYASVLDTIETHKKDPIIFVTSILPMNYHKWIADRYEVCNTHLQKMVKGRTKFTFYFDFIQTCKAVNIPLMRFREREGIDRRGAAHFVNMITGQLHNIKPLLSKKGLIANK